MGSPQTSRAGESRSFCYESLAASEQKKKKKHGNDLSVVYTNKNAFTIFFLVLYTHLLSHVVSRDTQVHEKKRKK